MKISPIPFLILLVAIIVLGGAVFFYDNFKGVLLLIREPESAPANSTETPAETPNEQGGNQTDFPLTLPAGFSISVFASDLPGARVIVPDSLGNFWVSQTSEG